jgi:hypothetical protein
LGCPETSGAAVFLACSAFVAIIVTAANSADYFPPFARFSIKSLWQVAE